MGQEKRGQQGNTSNNKSPGWMQKIASTILPSSANKRIQQNKEALTYDDTTKGGNPLHYQTHVGDDKMKNRQGRSGGSTCHHGKS